MITNDTDTLKGLGPNKIINDDVACNKNDSNFSKTKSTREIPKDKFEKPRKLSRGMESTYIKTDESYHVNFTFHRHCFLFSLVMHCHVCF